MATPDPDWSNRRDCEQCGAETGQPCTSRRGPGRLGTVLLKKEHKGRYKIVRIRGGGITDTGLIDDRLIVWKREARKGTLVADIARMLGMTRAALDQLVHRQRKAGHPDAVLHLHAQLKNPDPTPRQLYQRRQARESRRKRQAAHH